MVLRELSSPVEAAGSRAVFPPKEGVMHEWNFSSNADWLVALALIVAVAAAALA
jgi:hypothetical protein